MQSRFLIGAASSGSGKTTLTLGLLRAFVRRGLAVQPFKCGPDYIDPLYHRLATDGAGQSGRDSINLDLWMASGEHLRALYARFGEGADVCVTEGVMGLFDGYRAAQGSSAEVAHLLDMPVVLVIDARSMAYSVAPLLWGFRNFRGSSPESNLQGGSPESIFRGSSPEIAGVIFNRVGSALHYGFLAEAARDAGVEPLGWLPRRDDFAVPSRHLGLSLENLDSFSPTIDAIADALETHVDLDRLLELTRREENSPPASETQLSTLTSLRSLTSFAPRTSSCKHARLSAWRRFNFQLSTKKIAIARDEAFNFTYRANLDRFEELGGELHFFSPLHDATPPAGAHLIYLPGGYPEFFADRLSKNHSMREAIKSYAESGGRVLAECGGMLYLCRSLTPAENARSLPMCGVLPLDATMEGMRLRLGYREAHLANGLCIRGHEFHYSHIEGPDLPSAARQFSARGEEVATPLYRYKNTIAGYTHLYWAEGDPMQLFE